MTDTTNPQQPVRKGLLPTTPPPEWEFSSAFATGPDGEPGLLLIPGDAGPVVVRRRVTYGDWEPVRPDRWAEEPPSDVRAAVPVPASAPTDQAERRERYAAPLYALMRQNGWDGERTEPVVREMDLVLAAVLAVADAEQAELRRERDLAIAHDRQPYPTAWAYEQACAALNRKTETIERVRRLHDRLATETELASPGDRITRADAAKRIATALDAVPVSGPGGAADETQQPEAEAAATLARECVDRPAVIRWCADRVRSTDGDYALLAAAEYLDDLALEAEEAAVSQPEPAPPVDRCIHVKAIHDTHHKPDPHHGGPVTGCPWCTAAATGTEA